MHRQIAYLLIPLALLAAASCKKDDETTVLPSITGLSIGTSAPEYVALGDELTFNAITKSLTTSDKTTPEVIGLYWSVNSTKKDTLTRDIKQSNPPFVYRIDTLGSYSFLCAAFAEGYYGATSSINSRAIDPETAVQGLSGSRASSIGLRIIRTPELFWMAENYFGTESGFCYLNCPVTESGLGRFYSWEDAQHACPEGWRLPTEAEWDYWGTEAGALMAEASFLGESMWSYEPKVKITNSKGFNAIPAGYIDHTLTNLTHTGFGDYAAFWTADTQDGLACYRYLFSGNPQIQKGKGDKKTLALSVRCVHALD